MPEINTKKQEQATDVIIVGGGLAGLTSAMLLTKAGFDVVLIEKKDYPRHKVCGEYISNEIKPLLQSLGLYPEDPKPVAISRFQFSSTHQSPAETRMEMGGFGISRYALDFHLYKKALEAGVRVVLNTAVNSINFKDGEFQVTAAQSQDYRARVVIGAYGKRSALDKELDRRFIRHTTEYMAVKQHYHSDFPEDLVALHNFEGGYAGLSRVEDDKVNMCYLTDVRHFKRYRDLNEFQANHLVKNKSLATFLDSADPVFDKPLVISQISFETKNVVEEHVLMCGDSAGLIHPLCGNGMSMAIHSAVFCSEFVAAFLDGEIGRHEMEDSYTRAWNEVFNSRIRFGRYASKIFGEGFITDFAIRLAKTYPGLFRRSLRLSHGSYIHSTPGANG